MKLSFCCVTGIVMRETVRGAVTLPPGCGWAPSSGWRVQYGSGRANLSQSPKASIKLWLTLQRRSPRREGNFLRQSVTPRSKPALEETGSFLPMSSPGTSWRCRWCRGHSPEQLSVLGDEPPSLLVTTYQ